MRFRFNERKAAQAAAHLIQRAGGEIYFLALLKLMYLADRRSLVETGRPITGDRFVSMDLGPLLSRTYDRISCGTETDSEWGRLIGSPIDYKVALRRSDPPSDELSRYELRLLDAAFDEFGALDRWDLVRYTHTLPEWTPAGGSSVAIDPLEILRQSGVSEATIRAWVAAADEEWTFASLCQAAR